MSKLLELEQLGQSVWFDFIRRSLITSGGLQKLIDKGIRGVTSNPAIFEKAIAGKAIQSVVSSYVYRILCSNLLSRHVSHGQFPFFSSENE